MRHEEELVPAVAEAVAEAEAAVAAAATAAAAADGVMCDDEDDHGLFKPCGDCTPPDGLRKRDTRVSAGAPPLASPIPNKGAGESDPTEGTKLTSIGSGRATTRVELEEDEDDEPAARTGGDMTVRTEPGYGSTEEDSAEVVEAEAEEDNGNEKEVEDGPLDDDENVEVEEADGVVEGAER